jgi:hypothetical protein
VGGLQRPNGLTIAAGPVEEKEKGKNEGQKEFRAEIRDQIQTCCRILVFE